jgi:hypothetical protein
MHDPRIIESDSKDPQRALLISRNLYGEVQTRAVLEEFGVRSLPEQTLIRIQHTLVKVGAHFIELFRNSPRTSAGGLYKKAHWLISHFDDDMKVHDLIHVVESQATRGSLTPLFLSPIPEGETEQEAQERETEEYREEVRTNFYSAFHARVSERRSVDDFLKTAEDDIPEFE